MEVSTMGTECRFTTGLFRHSFEKALFWAVIFLAEFHMFACSFREVLPGYSEPFFRYERWIGAVILAILVIYVLYSAVRYPRTIRRIKHLFCRLCSFEQTYMLWVFVWYIIVLAVWQVIKGREVNLFKENDWWLFEQVLMSFVFFPLPRILGSERAKRLIEPMIKLVLIPHMMVWGWILWQYFHMNYITFPSGGTLEIIVPLSLSFGYNRNITGAGALIMMGLCLYFVTTQKKAQKILYIFGTAVYLTILILTNCRVSWYCTLLIAIFISIIASWYGLNQKSWYIRVFIGILLSTVSVLFLHWLRGELFVLLYAFHAHIQEASLTTNIEQSAAWGAQHTISPVSLNSHSYYLYAQNVYLEKLTAEKWTAANYARTVGTDTGGLSGRIPLYKATLDVMFSRKLIFFFGIPSTDFGAAVYGRYGISKYYPHPHNFLLAMGVYYGVPTMLFTAAFLISLFVRCFRVLFINKKQLFQGFWMIPVILAALVAEDMMESYLNLSAWSMTCITFYLFAGWVVAMDKETRENVERRENVV